VVISIQKDANDRKSAQALLVSKNFLHTFMLFLGIIFFFLKILGIIFKTRLLTYSSLPVASDAGPSIPEHVR
jgi:hypothetical protein